MKPFEEKGKRWVEVAEWPFWRRWAYPAIGAFVPAGFGIAVGILRHNTGLVIFSLIWVLVVYLIWLQVLRTSRRYLELYGHKRKWKRPS